MERPTLFFAAAILLATSRFFAPHPADWSVNLTGNTQQIIFQNGTGVPIISKEKNGYKVVFPLKFDHQEFNFGTVEWGKTVRHAFRFKNTGTTEVTIQSASTNSPYVFLFWP